MKKFLVDFTYFNNKDMFLPPKKLFSFIHDKQVCEFFLHFKLLSVKMEKK